MNESFFADLHVHPSFKNFNRSALEKKYDDIDKFNLHTPGTFDPNSHKTTEEHGSMWANYDQSHISECYITDGGNKYNTKLLFAALYPLEKGWVVGNASEDVNEADILIDQSGQKENPVRNFFNKLLKMAVKRTIYNDGKLRAFAQALYMNLTSERVRYFQGHIPGKIYDYYTDLFKEYEFIKRKDNTEVTVKNEKMIYKIIKTKKDLDDVMKNPIMIGLPLTIEGAHVFSVDISKGKYDAVPMDVMMNRVAEIKRFINPFFITMCHHFNNKLMGHAHSFPDVLATFTDQVENMNGGVTVDGIKIMRAIYGINDDNTNNANSSRTLIDIKHLSFRARKQLYADIIIPFNSKPTNKKIPVICSHCGYSGMTHLDDFEKNAPLGVYAKENDDRITTRNHGSSPTLMRTQFYKWNINLCDEDIKVIVESGGLIGLTFDQRVLGYQDINDEFITNTFTREAKTSNVKDEFWAQVILDHILFMADAWINYMGLNSKTNIFNCLCIGSDFDGIIDPINQYTTIKSFPVLKRNLKVRLSAMPLLARQHYGIDEAGGLTTDELIQKFCFDNALKFLGDNLK